MDSITVQADKSMAAFPTSYLQRKFQMFPLKVTDLLSPEIWC